MSRSALRIEAPWPAPRNHFGDRSGDRTGHNVYAGLSSINESSRNILTIEDPVEYMLPGVGQTQVNPKVDMTFAGATSHSAAGSRRRHGGGDRDLETAEIAVQASLTGHLVLSTPANTAIGAMGGCRTWGSSHFCSHRVWL